MANEPTVKCVKEADGFHVHTYTVSNGHRQFVIEHHHHEWMDNHRRLYPDRKDVDAHERYALLGQWDTVEEAWEALGVAGEIPPVACRA